MKGFSGHANLGQGVWNSVVPWLPVPVLAIVVWLASGQILQGEFFLDDYYQLHVYREGVSWFMPFTRDLWMGTYFRPGVVPAWLMAFAVFGESAAGHHLLDLLIVLATVLLLYKLTYRLTNSRAAAFFSALWFAVLPSTSTGAAFITNRFDVLGTMLFASCLNLVLFQGKRGRWAWTCLMFVTGLWCMLCKENMSTLPAVAGLLVWYDESRTGNGRCVCEALRSTWPLWLALVVYFIWRTIILKGIGGYQFTEAHFAPLAFLKTFAMSSMQSLEYPLATIAFLLAIVLYLGFTKSGDVRKLAGASILVLVITFLPMLLGSKGLALLFPLRLFYLSGVGASLLLGAAAWETGRRGFVGKALLVGCATLLALQAGSAAGDVVQYQEKTAKAVSGAKEFIMKNYSAAQAGSMFYFCDDDLDPVLDMAVKWTLPWAMDNVFILRCDGVTHIITRPVLLETASEHLHFQEGIRTNPVVHGDFLYGIIETNATHARELAKTRDDVHFVMRGSDGIFREVTTGLGAGR